MATLFSKFVKRVNSFHEALVSLSKNSFLKHGVFNEIDLVDLIEHAFWHGFCRVENDPVLSNNKAVREGSLDRLSFHFHQDLGFSSLETKLSNSSSLSAKWHILDWNNALDC